MDTRRYSRLINAINKIHRTGLAPETWPRALEAIAGCVDSSSAVMYTVDLRRRSAHNFRAHNIDPDCQARYLAHYHTVDPWLQVAFSAKVDQPLRGTSMVADSAMRRTEHYNDFLKPQDIRYLLTGLPLRTADRMVVLSFFHGVKQEDFDDESLEIYRLLLGAATQAMRVQNTIDELHGRSNGLAAALEQVSQAVVLLNRSGRVIQANSAAVDLLSAADGLSISGGRVEAALLEGRRALEKLMQAIAGAIPSAGPCRRRLATIPRPSGRRAYVVRIAPVDQCCDDIVDLSDLHEVPHLLMTISDPERCRRIAPPADVQAAYDLTPAEASLAVALVHGETVSQFAADQGIALDTARKRLKSVFQKTGTHRQAELVQRLVLDMT